MHGPAEKQAIGDEHSSYQVQAINGHQAYHSAVEEGRFPFFGCVADQQVDRRDEYATKNSKDHQCKYVTAHFFANGKEEGKQYENHVFQPKNGGHRQGVGEPTSPYSVIEANINICRKQVDKKACRQKEVDVTSPKCAQLSARSAGVELVHDAVVHGRPQALPQQATKEQPQARQDDEQGDVDGQQCAFSFVGVCGLDDERTVRLVT